MEEQNKEIKETESNEIPLEEGGLFGSNDTDGKHKKIRKPFFVGKKKRILQISIASISLVIIIFATVTLIRISEATKTCRELLKKDFFSKQILTEQMRINGFNDFEINSAIKASKVDFTDNMSRKLNAAIEKPSKILCKDDLKKELLNAGFNTEEIDNLFLSVNWDSFYKTYITNYFDYHDGMIKKNEFLDDLSKHGFNQQDILFFSSLTEWNTLAQKYIRQFFEENKLASKNAAKNYLESLGYKEDEIDNIFLNVDWNKQALTCITNYLNQDDQVSTVSKEEEVTKSLFNRVLKEMGFSESEIEYAKNNYNFSGSIEKIINTYASENKMLSKTELEKSLKNKQFTNDEIKTAFENVDWKKYAASTAAEHLAQNKANKNAALQYLKDNGYTDEEVASVESKAVWSTYANQALLFLQEGNTKTKDELFNTLKEYGYSDSDILSAKNSTSMNQYAYNYLMNTQTKETLALIGKTEIKTILDNAGYTNEYSFVIGRFDWSVQASKYLETVLAPYLNGPTVYNFDEIVVNMQNKGFSQNSDIANAFTHYDFSSFATKWASAYLNTADAMNKGKLDLSFRSMKVTNSKSLFEKVGGINQYADWVSFAKQVAGTYASASEASAALQTLGYAETEINSAIESVFPSN